MTQDEIIPLNIEDEYVRNYLWERALIAIDDPCTKSHPHENMNEYCQHKTKDEPVAWMYWQSCLNDDGTQTSPWVQRYSKFKPTESVINKDITPLYITPQRTWVGLTDEEITEIRLKTFDAIATNQEIYRAIEAKLKEKND